MNRKQNFLELILEVYQSKVGKRFYWGSDDCVSFACECVDAQWGTDLASEMAKYDYATKLTADDIIKQHGGTLVELIDTYMERKDVAFAQRGDVVLFNGEFGLTTGIMWTNGVMAYGPYGTEIFNVVITHAWGTPKCHQQ